MAAAPPECRIRDVQNVAKVTTDATGTMTLGVAVRPRQCVVDQLLAKQMSSGRCTNVFNSTR